MLWHAILFVYHMLFLSNDMANYNFSERYEISSQDGKGHTTIILIYLIKIIIANVSSEAGEGLSSRATDTNKKSMRPWCLENAGNATDMLNSESE